MQSRSSMEMVKCSCLNRVAHSKRSSNPLSHAKDEDWRFEGELWSSRFVFQLGGVVN
jgi:hypothetical protein